jgi:hypothetical protein
MNINLDRLEMRLNESAWNQEQLSFLPSLPQLRIFRTDTIEITPLLPFIIQQRELKAFRAPRISPITDFESYFAITLPSPSIHNGMDNTFLPNVVDVTAPSWLLPHLSSHSVSRLETRLTAASSGDEHASMRLEKALFRSLERWKGTLRYLAVDRYCCEKLMPMTEFLEGLAECQTEIDGGSDMHKSTLRHLKVVCDTRIGPGPAVSGSDSSFPQN